MMLSEFCMLSVLFIAPPETTASFIATKVNVAPQDPPPWFPWLHKHGGRPSANQGNDTGGGSPALGGGTPEPATLLLVTGSVLAYGALRRRSRKSAAPPAV
jgi:hypothetical protein